MRRTSLAVLRTQSDDRLVALARAGDERAFEAIVERHRGPLLRHAQRLLSDAGAEDAVQQAFLSAWSGLRRGADVRELSPWLHRIVHNVGLNLLRGAKRGEHAELTDAMPAGTTPEDELERRMAMRRTLAGVAALPDRQREAVLRVAVQGRSQEEVARALGLSHGAVAQLVLRGRRALRAAGGALTPQWLAEWLARLGSEAPSAITAGKVAAVVAVAGTAATGPALVEHRAERPPIVAEARAGSGEPARPGRREQRTPVTPAVGGGAALDDRSGGPSSGSAGSSGQGSGASERSGPSGSSGSESSGPGSDGADSSRSGSGGSGSGGSDSSGSGSGGSGSGGSDSSGSGPGESGSGGSDSSGSESSGSGSGGSSGSGASGSDTSGSSGVETSGSGSSAGDSSGSGPGSDDDD